MLPLLCGRTGKQSMVTDFAGEDVKAGAVIGMIGQGSLIQLTAMSGEADTRLGSAGGWMVPAS